PDGCGLRCAAGQGPPREHRAGLGPPLRRDCGRRAIKHRYGSSWNDGPPPAIGRRMQGAMDPTRQPAEQALPHQPGPRPAAPQDDARGGDEAVLALEQELAALREERLRERADTENQRRRMQRELEQARRFANERLLSELLPVLDSLERGLEAGGDVASLREGVELTLRQLLKVAADNGLQVVDPTGQAFDPERHEAMSVVPTAERPPNEVVQVFQKGYVLNDRLLRPALVVVSREPDGA